MGVDTNWNCYYNSERVAGWSVEAIATVLVHEVWHLLREHHKRAAALGVTALNADAWNGAADAEINDGLMQADLPFPQDITPITPTGLGMPDDLLAEDYYARMPEQSIGGSSFGGSCADGIARPWESSGKESVGKDGTISNETRRAISTELLAKHVAEEISTYPGKVPGNWKRWAKAITTPRQIPWQTVFRAVFGRLVTAGRKDDWSYTRPSRRVFLDPSFVMPGMVGTLPDVVLIGDTSGSMGEDALGTAIQIMDSVMEWLGRVYPVTVVAGDTCVQAVSKVTSGKNVKLEGGGGTDMRELIAHVLTLRPKPQIIVVVTDGYTPWPDCAPAGVQTVVVLVAKGESPTWATTVRVKP